MTDYVNYVESVVRKHAMTTTPSPEEAASPREQATACAISDERLDELVMATDMRGRYEPAEYCKRIDADTAAALRELQRRRAGGSALLWRPIDSAPREAEVLFAHHPSNYWRGKVHMGYVNEKGLVFEDGRCGWLINPQPAVWQPLPPPPRDAQRRTVSPAQAASAATEGEG